MSREGARIDESSSISRTIATMGNNSSDQQNPSPIIMQTHAYMSPIAPSDTSTPANDAQQEREVQQQPGEDTFRAMLSIQPLQKDEKSEAVIDTTDSTDTDNVPAIEQSGTSTTEGTTTTIDYSAPSSTTSPATQPCQGDGIHADDKECVDGVPSTPPPISRTSGDGQRPMATPAGPTQRIRRDNKLSMLYTPVKRGGNTTGIDNDNDDFLENEAGHERRKLPCNWMGWTALVVVVGGALMITTGVVVHRKKQAVPSVMSAGSTSVVSLVSLLRSNLLGYSRPIS